MHKAARFLRFGLVGLSGFALDTGTVYLLRGVVGLYVAGIAAYLVAASSNWALNRAWTFSAAPKARAARQWGRYVAATTVGFVLNRGVYALMIWQIQIARAMPVIALAAGTAAGLWINFVLAGRVFGVSRKTR